jgi:hypothetical protein
MDLPAFLYSLLIRLAADFIPGFQRGGRPRFPGRPKGTGKDDNFELYKEVMKRKHERRMSVRSACKALAKPPKWRREEASTLQARFYRFEKRIWSFKTDNYKALGERIQAIKAASR